MGTTLGIIGAVGTLVGGVFAYMSSKNRQRRSAEKDVRKQQEAHEMKKQEIRAAVYGHDESKLNAIVAKLLSRIVAVALGVAVVGCASRTTVYIPTDRRLEVCTNSLGYHCWAVPDAVMADMLERIAELDALKTEMAVDKRLTK